VTVKSFPNVLPDIATFVKTELGVAALSALPIIRAKTHDARRTRCEK
jgi:hypothetical protein